MFPRTASALLLLTLAACATGIASARTSDRNQPMDAAANTSTCNLGTTGHCELNGAVKIVQGTLDINAAKAIIYRRASGDIDRAVFNGEPVVLKQILDDGTPMTARASNIDYDLEADVVIFTGDVHIQQPTGSLSGQRVVYNLKTSSVEGRGDDNGQVHMRILPSSKRGTRAKPGATPPTAGEAAPGAPQAPTAPAAAEPDSN